MAVTDLPAAWTLRLGCCKSEKASHGIIDWTGTETFANKPKLAKLLRELVDACVVQQKKFTGFSRMSVCNRKFAAFCVLCYWICYMNGCFFLFQIRSMRSFTFLLIPSGSKAKKTVTRKSKHSTAVSKTWCDPQHQDIQTWKAENCCRSAVARNER